MATAFLKNPEKVEKAMVNRRVTLEKCIRRMHFMFKRNA